MPIFSKKNSTWQMEWLVAVVTLGVFCNQKKHEVLISVDKIEKKPIAFCAVIVEKARQIIKNLGGFLTTSLSRMEYLFRIFSSYGQLLKRPKPCTLKPRLTLGARSRKYWSLYGPKAIILKKSYLLASSSHLQISLFFLILSIDVFISYVN